METDTKYQMFNLINKEFTFDVDVSNLPCGLNGALYFVEMASDGGIGKGNNKAGAKYGTGRSSPSDFLQTSTLTTFRVLRLSVPPRHQVDQWQGQQRWLGI